MGEENEQEEREEGRIADRPMDLLVSDVNAITLKALLDVVREIRLFCDDVKEKLESIGEASKAGENRD